MNSKVIKTTVVFSLPMISDASPVIATFPPVYLSAKVLSVPILIKNIGMIKSTAYFHL